MFANRCTGRRIQWQSLCQNCQNHQRPKCNNSPTNMNITQSYLTMLDMLTTTNDRVLRIAISSMSLQCTHCCPSELHRAPKRVTSAIQRDNVITMSAAQSNHTGRTSTRYDVSVIRALRARVAAVAVFFKLQHYGQLLSVHRHIATQATTNTTLRSALLLRKRQLID